MNGQMACLRNTWIILHKQKDNPVEIQARDLEKDREEEPNVPQTFENVHDMLSPGESKFTR